LLPRATINRGASGATRSGSPAAALHFDKEVTNLGLPVRGKEFVSLPEDELKRKVRFLGLPESVVKTLDPKTATSNLLPATAPFDGVVAERQVALGEVVDSVEKLCWRRRRNPLSRRLRCDG
jgi:membrane fusion protein, heavy metal efflux system